MEVTYRKPVRTAKISWEEDKPICESVVSCEGGSYALDDQST